MSALDLHDKQRRRLKKVTEWASKARSALGPIMEASNGRVHFRPSSTAVTMVGLLPERPQRGRGNFRNLERLARDFESLFDTHCRHIDHGKPTGEKALQSHLISEAYRNGRRLSSINAASSATDDPVELIFVTDEIPLPVERGKIVCDILALRRDGGRSVPVVIELKDSRMLARLIHQVESYATLIDEHAESFAALFGAVLGEPVAFTDFAEQWIVWPCVPGVSEPHERRLAERGIRVVGYEALGGGYSFNVGIPRPRCPSCQSSKAVVRIVYGEPTWRAAELAEEGKMMLGGCLFWEGMPKWTCGGCTEDF